MKKYELYNQALKQVQELERERTIAMSTIEELCAEWNITLSNNQAQIVIQKGKVTQIVKEISNDNEEYIQQLLKDLQNRNDRIEQLKAQLKKEQQDYRDLEVQDREELEYADKEIKQLRAQLKAAQSNNNNNDSELYAEYSALRNSYGELSEAYDILADDIATHNDTIEELKMQIDIQKEELEYYHSKEKEYEEDVEGMEMDIEALKLQMEGMKFAYENEIAALKAQIAQLTKPVRQWELVDDPDFNEPEVEEDQAVVEEEPVVEEPVTVVEESDAMVISLPEELRNNEYICNLYESTVAMLKDVKGNKYQTKEQREQQLINNYNEAVAKALEEAKELNKYNVTVKRVLNNKTKAYTSVYGKITLAGKEYAYKYDATFEYPTVYGCMDMSLIEEARNVLIPLAQFTLSEGGYADKHMHAVIYDFAHNIVVWQTDDGAFKGYTDKYAFTWDTKYGVPCGDPVINAVENRRNKKMNKSCWSKGPEAEGQRIMKYCREIMNQQKNNNQTKEATNTTKEVTPNTKEIHEETNEIVVNVTKEVVVETNEVELDEELAGFEW